MLICALLDGFSFLISLLGFRGIHIVSRILGFILFDILRVRRKMILKNLDIAFKDEMTKQEKISIGRRSTMNFVATIFEFITSQWLFKKVKVTYRNPEVARNVIAKNQGLYVICIHLGNWELLCHKGSNDFAKVHVVVKPIGSGGVRKWVEKVRTIVGYELIDRKGDISATSQIFAALDKKEAIGFIVDQRRAKGEKVPFFGKEAYTNNSLFKLWYKRNAPIVPALIHRTGVGSHEILFFPEFSVENQEGWTMEQMINVNTRKMNETVEQMIRIAPDEYFWMHNRWK